MNTNPNFFLVRLACAAPLHDGHDLDPGYEAAGATRFSALSRLQIAKDAQDGLAQEPDRTSAVLRLTFIQFVQHPWRANRA